MSIEQLLRYSTEEVRDMLDRGPSETLEIRRKVCTVKVLADHIAGFANHQGGVILFGYNSKTKKITGCNQTRLQKHHESAEQLLAIGQLSTLSFVSIDGKQIGVLAIPKVSRLVDSPGGLLVRFQTTLRAMPKGKVVEILQLSRTQLSIEDWGALLHRLNTRVEDTGERIRRESGLLRKIQEQLLGVAIGVLFTLIVNLIAWQLGVFQFVKD